MRRSRNDKALGKGPCGSWILILLVSAFAAPAWSQQPLPQYLTGVEIGGSPPYEVIYRIDLDTLPPRPRLIVEVTPQSQFEDIELEVRLENWINSTGGSGGGCHQTTDVLVATESSGPVTLIDSLYNCDPDENVFNSGEVDVAVKVESFGAAGLPAEVDISIYAITVVPANSQLFQVNSDLSAQTVSLFPSKDTTIYGRNQDASNGAGTLLWAGADVQLISAPPFGFWSRQPLRPLLAFNVLTLPFNAQINSAELRLYASSVLNSGGVVSLFKVAASPNEFSWTEGLAMPTGSQFDGAIDSSAANWLDRGSASQTWFTPGGDVEGAALDSLSITSGTSYQTFASPALDAAVQAMLDTRNDDDGFLMTGPGTSSSDFADRGVSFFSNDAPFSVTRPQLTLNYNPTESWSQGAVEVNTVSFTNEGSDFRWVYDTDADDIFVTEIGGVCEVVPYDPNMHTNFPYTYSFSDPNYTGVDCCTWNVDSDASGTVGAGQALFFHNVDASIPANHPPDTDGDGIADLCDNCVAQPNASALGTCLNGASIGGTCRSNLECAAGEVCDLGQLDTDFDGYGDACPVPEPGFGGGLLAAGALLAALTGRSRLSSSERRWA